MLQLWMEIHILDFVCVQEPATFSSFVSSFTYWSTFWSKWTWIPSCAGRAFVSHYICYLVTCMETVLFSFCFIVEQVTTMEGSVNLDPTMATASMKLSKTSQVQVIFRNVEETYPIGVDIQCTYSVNGSLEVGSRDWVGLYKVGWRSQSDYYYYDWSPLPSDYVKGKSFEGKIVYPGMIFQYYILFL